MVVWMDGVLPGAVDEGNWPVFVLPWTCAVHMVCGISRIELELRSVRLINQ